MVGIGEEAIIAAEAPEVEQFDVPFLPGQSILDGLRSVRAAEDASGAHLAPLANMALDLVAMIVSA
jgi:hypothetical protein